MTTAKRRRPGRRWPWGKMALVIAGAAAAIVWLERADLAARAAAGTAYGARIGCACHHIGGRDLDDCARDFEPGMELVFLDADEEERSVTATIPLLASDIARFRDGYGCVLDPRDREGMRD